MKQDGRGVDYACIVQQGQAAEREHAALAAGLQRIGRDFFGDEPDAVKIQWTSLAPGHAWTAGEPSRSSIVVRSVPVGFPDDRREAFLRQVCELWVEVTGCTLDEIVATAYDGPLPL